jgi:hypothetical protein
VEAPVTARESRYEKLPEVPAEQLDSSSEKFNWFAAWYPVAAMDTLKPDRPTKVQLLGQDFVVWRDNQGEWQAFEDTCPHRWVRHVGLKHSCWAPPCAAVQKPPPAATLHCIGRHSARCCIYTQ